MFERNDKRRLYCLIDQLLEGNIDVTTFCNEFYYSYDLELDLENLSAIEQKEFKELSLITDRFSEFKSDHQEHPGVYNTEEQLMDKVKEVKRTLIA